MRTVASRGSRAHTMKKRVVLKRQRRAMAKRMVRDQKLRTLADAKTFAQEWIVVAMSYAAEADFYRELCERAFKRGVATARRRSR